MSVVVLLGNGNTGFLYVTSAGLELETFCSSLHDYKHGPPSQVFPLLSICWYQPAPRLTPPCPLVFGTTLSDYLGSSDPFSVRVWVRDGVGWGACL